MRFTIAAFFTLLSILPIMSHAGAGEVSIDVSEVWARPVFMTGRTGAAYFAIRNNGDADDRLLSVKTLLSARAELHEHIHDNGVMKMRQVDHVDVAAGETVMFRPGGYHVMIFDVQKKLSEGDSFPMTLTFEHGGDIEVTAHVMKQAPLAEHDHSAHH
ncbi:copper chaperone PCu(A)C [Emcibacter sp.]|uniref:copper chaperone PCu(A)C n=1 Tax=Emcibacter sp. TaxID=1979954 RepID=UPI002AA7739D|nr:copper chaperone PCu(A)C [Emcibacter sp.]